MVYLHIDRRLGGVARHSLVEREPPPVQVSPEIRKCVVFVGREAQSGFKWCATAFLVGVRIKPSGDDKRTVVYLVTARHVIDGIRAISTDGAAYLRLNTLTGGCETVQIDLDAWRFHPSKESDVAAVMVDASIVNAFDHKVLPAEMFCDDEVIAKEGIGPGDEVFLTGLYTFHHGQQRNLPIIRVGNIACMPEEPLRMRLDANTRITADAYLIESRSIKGLSGSPVFVHLAPLRSKRGGINLNTSSKTYFLGVMHGHWDVDEPVTDSDSADAQIDQSIKSSVNAGIAMIVPAQIVLELMDHPEFVRMRQAVADQLDDENAATPDMDDNGGEDINVIAKRVVDQATDDSAGSS